VPLRHAVVNLLNTALGALDARIVRRSLADQQQADLEELRAQAARLRKKLDGSAAPPLQPPTLPLEAEQYLHTDNPRLVELRRRYRTIRGSALAPSLWTNSYVEQEIDLRRFRGDNAYVWQFRDDNSFLTYILTTYYVQRIDRLGLLEKLTEDGLFGACVFDVNDGLRVSRDLLDSIVELYFLERHIGLSSWPGISMLDIGSGYGRLAHRAVQAFSTIGRYLCVDAVAESTFLAEFYLRYREVEEKASVVPVFELEEQLDRWHVDVALNIHSFSECPIAAITWWVELLRRHRVRYLMIVPNREHHGGTRLLSREVNGEQLEFQPVLESRGYRLIQREPKYLDAIVQAHGVSPTYHYLFELALSSTSAPA
jgi:hypothetical protein